MTRNAKAPAPVLVGLPCGTPSAWHSGARVFPPEQHRRTRSLSAHQAQMSTSAPEMTNGLPPNMPILQRSLAQGTAIGLRWRSLLVTHAF